jgi:hypothetical protein
VYSQKLTIRVVIRQGIGEAFRKGISFYFFWQSIDKLNHLTPHEKVAMLFIVEVYATEIFMFLK